MHILPNLLTIVLFDFILLPLSEDVLEMQVQACTVTKWNAKPREAYELLVTLEVILERRE
jgi:hypothetical protein